MYEGDPGGSIEDEVRFLLGDTDTENELLSEDEIDYLVAEHTTAIAAAYNGALVLAARFAAKRDVSVGSARIEYGAQHGRYAELSKTLASRGGASATTPGSVGPPQAGGLASTSNPLQSTSVDWRNPTALGT